MNKSQLLAVLLLGASLSGCWGKDSIVVDCDDGLKYQNRDVGNRVVAPEGMDQLDEFAEMPIPRADPAAPETPPGKCLDMPPAI
jgi:hypothetical protein